MRNWVTTALIAGLLVAGLPVAGWAAEPAPAPMAADMRTAASRPASAFRLKPLASSDSPALKVNDPQSMLRSGYGGALIDLFPFEGGKFHVSAGGKLFGRAGRPRTEVEPLRPLQPFRAGALRGGRRSPAMLVGYGRTVERGLAFGVDAGVVMGRLGAVPDRTGRLNRRRLDSLDGRGRQVPVNQIARVTALYRF